MSVLNNNVNHKVKQYWSFTLTQAITKCFCFVGREKTSTSTAAYMYCAKVFQ